MPRGARVSSANARRRFASVRFFSAEALACNDAAVRFNFARLLLLMCEFSAPLIASRRPAIRSAGKACERSNWSTYAFATTKLAGHTSFCWF